MINPWAVGFDRDPEIDLSVPPDPHLSELQFRLAIAVVSVFDVSLQRARGGEDHQRSFDFHMPQIHQFLTKTARRHRTNSPEEEICLSPFV